jgi:extradiol dioxygenase family protein
VIKGVANVWMPVEDVERAKGFYRDTLELPVVKDEGEWVEFDANGMRVALNRRKLARKKAAGSLRRMTVFVRHENVGRLLKFFGYRLE